MVFAGHHWPRWGRERIVDFLAKQRDLYGYIHDQTLRLLNKGLLAAEIAEVLELPPGLEREWHCRGYYGSLSHNVKAVYQRYLGWFDGNPAHLWPHPPQAAGGALRGARGGRRALLENAREAYDDGDYRWVAELVNHLVFADPDNAEARELQARALEQLGFGAENATWRNFFLMGALELRDGRLGERRRRWPRTCSPDSPRASCSTRSRSRSTGPARARRRSRCTGRCRTPARSSGWRSRTACSGIARAAGREDVQATVTIERSALNELILGRATPEELLGSGRLKVDGDAAALGQLLSLVDPPDRGFAIVTP